MSYTIGIDPGSQGAIAIFEDSKLISLHDMPTYKTKYGTCLDEHEVKGLLDYYDYRNGFRIVTTYIELVNAHAVPEGQITAAFSFGGYFHSIRCVLGVMGIPYDFITPTEWKKTMHVQGRGKAGKEIARAKACQLWPEWSSKFVKSRDGRADAALIGEAGRIRNASRVD